MGETGPSDFSEAAQKIQSRYFTWNWQTGSSAAAKVTRSAYLFLWSSPSYIAGLFFVESEPIVFFKTLGLHGAAIQNKRGLKENRTALVWDNEDLLWIRAALESENMHHNVWKSCGTGARDLVFTLWKNCSSTEITNTFRVTWKSPQQGVKAEKSHTFMFYLQSTSVTIGGLLIRRFVWSRSVIRCSHSAVAFVFLSSCWKWELPPPPHQHHHQQCVCTDHTVRAAPTQLCSAVTGRLFCLR